MRKLHPDKAWQTVWSLAIEHPNHNWIDAVNLMHFFHADSVLWSTVLSLELTVDVGFLGALGYT